MRDAFASELNLVAKDDSRVVLLSGDIGNRMFDDFKLSFPDRFLNCGVAEANMISVAAGMAHCGLRPIAYTIAPFITSRCLEQIRVDLCYHNTSVIIVGVGAGLCYAANGATHESCEDIAFLRSLPNMTVVCPGDSREVRPALRAAVERGGPVYIRLGKKGEPVIHDSIPEFRLGKGIVVRKGERVCILSTGNVLPIVVKAAENLEELGISTEVVSVHTVKPLDEELLSRVFSSFELAVTVEEHSIIGGLGSGVAEWLADHGPLRTRLCRLGTGDTFLCEAGGQDHVREHFGLTPSGIKERVLSALASSQCGPVRA